MKKGLAKEKILKLVHKYNEAVGSRRATRYTEEETKKDFILPLFEALGWNVFDKREVSAEEHQASGGRVDYGFYLHEQPKFYLEAKPLKADIFREEYARQAIRYSWNKGVTWAVLTDFETVLVFNTQDIDKSLSGKLYFKIPASEFINRFDQLWSLSREAFASDLINIEAEKIGKKLQKISVGATLYKDLKACRELLTHDLAIWNKKIDANLLDEGVQRILDRLIFLRVAEDRGIEPPTLIPLVREWEEKQKSDKNKEHLYQSMITKFRELDEIYNSNLFSPHPFEKWEEYSNATEKVITILYGKRGYYEYDFKVIPADVLGGVYENYLGYRLSKSQKGVAVDKDAKKRKEQGIYYTPPFIVDYIVKNTLKPILDNCKSVAELKKIKVLDPACGSGSFLIKALEVIAEKYKEFGYDDPYVKLPILEENIYGVDLDEQAVEIARLNLLVNSLDGRVKMPLLSKNIKNGNSLISGTDGELKKIFGKNFRKKKPFNWEEEFPEVFKQGGFDVVIGNPPYVNLVNIKDVEEREYLKTNFETAKNKSDLYSFFAEKGTKLLRPNGMLGFIFSNSWLGTDSFSKFREFLVNNTTVTELVKLPPDVFASATVTTVLIFLQKRKAHKDHKVKLLEYVDAKFIELPTSLGYKRIKESPGFSFSFEAEVGFEIPTVPLGEVAKFSLGIKTSDDERFISDSKKDNNSYKILRGKDVGRYSYVYADKWLWYKPNLMMEKVGAGPRKLKYFLTSKIIIKDVAQEIIAAYDDKKYLTTDTLSLIYAVQGYDPKFILALLNSKLVNKWFKVNFPAGLHIKINQMEHIPIPKIVEKRKQAEMVDSVNKILQLNDRLHIVEENSNEWQQLKSEIAKTDKKIDEAVYKLYGLTPEDPSSRS